MHRLADVGFRAEVEHGVERPAREDLVEDFGRLRLGQVDANELGSLQRRPVPFAEVVEDDDLLPAREELAERVRADVARAPGDEKRALGAHSSAPADPGVGEA